VFWLPVQRCERPTKQRFAETDNGASVVIDIFTTTMHYDPESTPLPYVALALQTNPKSGKIVKTNAYGLLNASAFVEAALNRRLLLTGDTARFESNQTRKPIFCYSGDDNTLDPLTEYALEKAIANIKRERGLGLEWFLALTNGGLGFNSVWTKAIQLGLIDEQRKQKLFVPLTSYYCTDRALVADVQSAFTRFAYGQSIPSMREQAAIRIMVGLNCYGSVLSGLEGNKLVIARNRLIVCAQDQMLHPNEHPDSDVSSSTHGDFLSIETMEGVVQPDLSIDYAVASLVEAAKECASVLQKSLSPRYLPN